MKIKKRNLDFVDDKKSIDFEDDEKVPILKKMEKYQF